jgi:hypothetical protein
MDMFLAFHVRYIDRKEGGSNRHKARLSASGG